MSTPAKVHSSEAIEAIRMALMSFAAQVGDALTELSAEMRRMQEWLEHDRPRHWKMQIRRAGDMAHEAQQTMRHEMFEYEGRISQLVRLVEVEVPQAIGVLNKILRNLEEYHAVRARDPRTAYDEVAMARAIWDDNGEKKEDETEDGEAA